MMNPTKDKRFIIPAIDIIDSRLVRLRQGDYRQVKQYEEDPVEMAKRFESVGIERLHIVDLDGARKGSIRNLAVLEKIAHATKMAIDFGGGVKTEQDVSNILNAGASMVTIGSLAVKEPQRLQEWIGKYGTEHFFIGADVYRNKIRISGWQEESSLELEEFLQEMISLGASRFFCTDIEKDGMLQGPASALYKNILQKFPGIQSVASGGISKVEELGELYELGISGAIVGKAIYEGNISLEQLAGWNQQF